MSLRVAAQLCIRKALRVDLFFVSFLVALLIVWVRTIFVSSAFSVVERSQLQNVVHTQSHLQLPAASRGIVLCAHNSESVRRAWTQIKALQTLYSMHNESFAVFHASELNYEDEGLLDGLRQLKTLSNVQIQDLAGWYSMAYDTEPSDEGIQRFRGFFCKVGALLAAPYDVVALVDLDAVLMANPLALVDAPIFRETGTYLFRDRRISAENKYRQQSANDYRKRLKELLHHFHPDGDHEAVSTFLDTSPPFTGWSYDYGESAVVVIDKRRNANALRVLQDMVGPHLFDLTTKGIHGDKELYWQAHALAGETPGMNPFACAEVGTKNDRGDTCCHQWTNAQWTWVDGKRPRIFYVNGDGVERLVEDLDSTLFDAFVSDPIDYFSNRTHIDDDPCCNAGANRLPVYVMETFHAYRLMYASYVT